MLCKNTGQHITARLACRLECIQNFHLSLVTLEEFEPSPTAIHRKNIPPKLGRLTWIEAGSIKTVSLSDWVSEHFQTYSIERMSPKLESKIPLIPYVRECLYAMQTCHWIVVG